MMERKCLMIRYGELSTKGKNKKVFIDFLYRNIKHALKSFSNIKIQARYDHIYVHVDDSELDLVIKRLQEVSGIKAMSLVFECEKNIDIIKKECLRIVEQETGNTFKIKCKRADKSFGLRSEEIINHVAGMILSSTSLKVDVHTPDILLSIEIRQEATYIFCHTYLGLGGYPLGVGGKVMHMLSGGIDSPVSAYLLMRRGLKIECIHFASPPYTKEGVIYKLIDLLKQLNTYQETIKLHIVPFTKIQEAIYENCPESYAITIMRRMMYRLAERLAKKRECHGISNGESIGQVASQTLHSLEVINEVTSFPIIRPLSTTDKTDIIDIAKRINTYDISIRPFEDCCTIFSPKNPKTMPKLNEVKQFEKKFDFNSLIDEALNNVEVRTIKEEDSDLF